MSLETGYQIQISNGSGLNGSELEVINSFGIFKLKMTCPVKHVDEK